MGATFTNPFCPDCGARMQRTARFCPDCHAEVRPPRDRQLRDIGSNEAEANRLAAKPRLTRRQFLTIAFSGAIVVLGSVMPWAGYGIFNSLAPNGDGFATLVAGLVMVAAARFGYRRAKRTGAVVAAIAAGVAFYMAIDFAREFIDAPRPLGIGFAAVVVASLVGGIAAIVALLRRTESV